MNIQIKDKFNGFGFFFVDDERAVDQIIAVGSKAAVPFTLACLLKPTFHGLNSDIFAFDFGNSRQNRNNQLACVLGGINAILYTDQINPKILHGLQGRKDIGGVASKA